jgi:hypothetical protein
MFERGPLDHLGFTVADKAALSARRGRCGSLPRTVM